MVLCFSHSIFRSHKSRDLKNDLGIFICVEKPLPGPSDSSHPPGAGVQSGSEGHTWAPHTHDTTCCGWKSLRPGPQHCSGFPPYHTPLFLGNSSRDTNPHPQSPRGATAAGCCWEELWDVVGTMGTAMGPASSSPGMLGCGGFAPSCLFYPALRGHSVIFAACQLIKTSLAV